MRRDPRRRPDRPIRAAFPGEPPPPGLGLADLGPVAGSPAVRPALLGRPFDDPFVAGTVRCDACAHRCVVRPGRLGICGVRQNRAGRLYTLVYGEIVAARVEPIEKKPFYHFLPGTTALSLATRGCNFHCAYCQNWEIAQSHREAIVPAARQLPPPAAVEMALAAGAASVAYTYVEPTVFLEYAIDTMALARSVGLRNVFVTNGYQTPEALALLAPTLDAANVDLKAFDELTYRRVCGARLQPVLAALVELRERGVWLEVTTLLVPGLTDGRRDLAAMADWIVANLGAETPWHLSRFHPAHRLAASAATPLRTLLEAASIARSAGLRHVYLGNAGELGAEATRCAGCDRTLIERAGYRVSAWHLRDGRCPGCGRRLVGVGLDRRAGDRRRPDEAAEDASTV